MIAPRIPASTVPDRTDSATTTGCRATCLPMISGCSTWPSSWPMRAMPTVTMSAVTNPCAASATTAAMIIARGAPMSGMNAPMKTSTASGAASGTPRIVSRTNARIPSASAMMTVPRAKPENVYQPAAAASCQRARYASGIWPRNQRHICAPELTKNTVQKIASATTMKPSTTDPALCAAWLSRFSALSATQSRPWSTRSSIWSTVTETPNGPSSRRSRICWMPVSNSPASCVHCPATEATTYVSRPPNSRMPDRRASAVASGRGIALAYQSVTGRSTEVSTSARKTATNTIRTCAVA